ncbi:MAG: GCN5-related N-acetyltransferase [Gemmatimonadetes bacterium]|nr:GCN5-related N-acetyltransferase [Gemmatimonadota bacterium]
MTVEHDAQARRFFVRTAHGLAYLAYEQKDGDVIDLQHTVVPDSAQGEGVGESLVRAALDHAKATSSKIIPTCTFVRGWIDKHPEFRRMIAPPTSRARRPQP